jgi:hypothetical protein
MTGVGNTTAGELVAVVLLVSACVLKGRMCLDGNKGQESYLTSAKWPPPPSPLPFSFFFFPLHSC